MKVAPAHGRDNNFDSLRMIAATAVIASHSVPLSSGGNEGEFIWRASGGQITLGLLAVVTFFVMSGYLIATSLERSASLRGFAVARMLRLFPALAVCVVALALAAGPLVSELPVAEYYRSRGVYLFIVRNLAFYYTETLPLVFQSNPLPGAMNGSLWTLRYEVGCYAVLASLAFLHCLRPLPVVALYAAAAAAAIWTADERLMLVGAFLGGAAVQKWRLRPSGSAACASLAGWVVSTAAGFAQFGAVLFAPLCVLFVALSPGVRLPRLAAAGDLSYGTYIYAFPLQQFVAAALGAAVTWYWNLALALPAVLATAYLSWRFIEAPSLALKQRLQPQAARMVVS